MPILVEVCVTVDVVGMSCILIGRLRGWFTDCSTVSSSVLIGTCFGETVVSDACDADSVYGMTNADKITIKVEVGYHWHA